MKKILSQHGKTVWRQFYPYVGRAWCACGLLIKSRLESGSYDLYLVTSWLGHRDPKTTMGYVKQADLLYHKYPFDWFRYVLRTGWGKTGEIDSRNQFFKTLKIKMVLTEIPPCKENGPGGIRTRDLQLRRLSPYPG